MPVSRALATWEGTLGKGSGNITVESKAFDERYDKGTRFEGKPGLNPEELLGAAFAGCYSMALAHALSEDGHKVNQITTGAQVTMSKSNGGFEIGQIHLTTTADVSDIDDDKFRKLARETKEACPIAKALCVKEVTISATLTRS